MYEDFYEQGAPFFEGKIPCLDKTERKSLVVAFRANHTGRLKGTRIGKYNIHA
jgi:hypothetical protein